MAMLRIRACVLDKELTLLTGEEIEDIHSMDQSFAMSVYLFRVGSWIGSLLGGLALLLTLSWDLRSALLSGDAAD